MAKTVGLSGMPLHMTTSGFSWHHLNQWHFGVVPLAAMALALALYVFAMRRVGDWSRARLASFVAAILVTFVSTQSVLGVYDMVYFSAHMIQHLALIMVAAPLFALSAPLDLWASAGGARTRAFFDGRVMSVLTHPLVGFATYFVVIPLTHLSGIANEMMLHQWVHHAEQIAFLVVGYLFFRAAFGLERGRTIHPGLRLVYVMTAVPVDTFTGLALVMSSTLPFPAYRAMAPTGSSSAWLLSNVHLGGAIMWIGGDALMLLACIPITAAWVKWETQRTKVLDAQLDELGI
ncbi:MAG: cytochrome c oxidase assembly protein [Actinomycetota bacterium]|nr:cytochrome c oxidase assembly protein [Actinomycetota bacterium]